MPHMLNTEEIMANKQPYGDNLSHDVRKPVFGDSDQVRHKPGYTATKDS